MSNDRDTNVVSFESARNLRENAAAALSRPSAETAQAPATQADFDAVMSCLTYLKEEAQRLEAPTAAHFLGAAKAALEDERATLHRG